MSGSRERCISCGHDFMFCGCPGKSLQCNDCNPTQQAGPRIYYESENPMKAQVGDKGYVEPEVMLKNGCARTRQQVIYWRGKVENLRNSGAYMKLNSGFSYTDMNRMIGTADSALNTGNYCFKGIEEVESFVVMAMVNNL